METFDVVIIGSGQGGTPLATACAKAGKRTALIERKHVGGTCINEGCTPTKTMIASGRAAYMARRGPEYGVHTGDVSIDMRKVRQRKRDIVDQWRSGSEHRIEQTDGLELIKEEACFTGPKTLRAGDREIQAETIVINVGERPSPLQIPGADTVEILNSTSVMELAEVPAHLVIIGGGYIGLEFGQLFRRLGSEVTILQHSGQLLSKEDPDIAKAVQDVLEEDGIRVLLKTEAQAFRRGNDGIDAVIDDSHILHASHVLGATGRTSNADSLDLDKVGVETDKRGQIPTSDTLETNVPGIYAIGDVRPGPKFTHISYDDYRILQANLIAGEHTSIAGRIVPYVVYIDPQLGRVGMTESQARQSGKQIRVASMPMSSVARAAETDETRGVMKAVVDAETDLILGAAILGIEGGEIMSMIEIAMWGNLPYTRLRDGIFAHPALSESLNNLFFAFREE